MDSIAFRIRSLSPTKSNRFFVGPAVSVHGRRLYWYLYSFSELNFGKAETCAQKHALPINPFQGTPPPVRHYGLQSPVVSATDNFQIESGKTLAWSSARDITVFLVCFWLWMRRYFSLAMKVFMRNIVGEFHSQLNWDGQLTSKMSMKRPGSSDGQNLICYGTDGRGKQAWFPRREREREMSFETAVGTCASIRRNDICIRTAVLPVMPLECTI